MNNRALERLENGEIALGVGVRLARSVEIAKMMRASGFDWLFIDLEHGSLSLETTSQISIAAADNNIAPIVRVPAGRWDMASRALDGGALGIVIPHMDTAEDAEQAVHHLRFPPLGHRGTLGGLPHYDYLPVPAAQVASEVNAVTLIAPMIESPEAGKTPPPSPRWRASTCCSSASTTWPKKWGFRAGSITRMWSRPSPPWPRRRPRRANIRASVASATPRSCAAISAWACVSSSAATISPS
jgi:hypothetical protein